MAKQFRHNFLGLCIINVCILYHSCVHIVQYITAFLIVLLVTSVHKIT